MSFDLELGGRRVLVTGGRAFGRPSGRHALLAIAVRPLEQEWIAKKR